MDRAAFPRTLLPLLLILLSALLAGCNGEDGERGPAGDDAGGNAFTVSVDGIGPNDPEEKIFVRKVGHGDQVIVLVPGNNTSGASFEPLLQVFRAVDTYNDTYTVYALDYRGSGRSSYNTKITGLGDFATDFERVLEQLEDSHGLPETGVTLVGYSMGFGVALEMLIQNPARYDNLVGLAPVGTRGVRVAFNAAQAGTDRLGTPYAAGDWVPVSSDAAGIAATELHQASWQGENRTFANVQFIWDLLVFNDVLQYDINTFSATDTAFRSNPGYQDALLDVLGVEYMPESLYYAHKFNVSDSDVSAPAANSAGSGGETVTVAGDGRLNAAGLTGKNALLVKATTDFGNWRGDQVIYDNYVATSKFDLKEAGATTTAVLIDADQGYDHGFPITRPTEVARLLHAFVQGNLTDAGAASTALGGATLQYYDHAETSFETDVFTGL